MADPSRVKRIVETMAAGAILSLAAYLAFGDVPTPEQWGAVAFFTAFGSLASALSYRTSGSTSGNVGFLPFMSVSILSPNAAALLAIAVSMVVGEIVIRRPLIKLVFNTAQQVFAAAIAIFVFLLLGGASPITDHVRAVPFVALVATYFTLNKLAVSTVIAASTNVGTWSHWLRSIKGSFVYDALAMPLIVVFAVAYARLGATWTALLVLPTLGIRQLYRTIFVLEKVNEELLQLMVASIEARDPYTSGHSQRVARYAKVIAERSGMGGKQVERAVVAALLHDVGKIFEEYAPILRKPGRLSDEEFVVMKTHPIKSAELVQKVSHFSDIVPAVRAHHEAWDGSGYPDQLLGSQIPIAARVIALADTIDAMCTSRPYRAAMSAEVVREEIRMQSGRQFDPSICAALLKDDSWRALEEEIARANEEHPLVSSSDAIGRTAEHVVRSR
jgi:putative nucleotidyltransferase with HDIG domain